MACSQIPCDWATAGGAVEDSLPPIGCLSARQGLILGSARTCHLDDLERASGEIAVASQHWVRRPGSASTTSVARRSRRGESASRQTSRRVAVSFRMQDSEVVTRARSLAGHATQLTLKVSARHALKIAGDIRKSEWFHNLSTCRWPGRPVAWPRMGSQLDSASVGGMPSPRPSSHSRKSQADGTRTSRVHPGISAVHAPGAGDR